MLNANPKWESIRTGLSIVLTKFAKFSFVRILGIKKVKCDKKLLGKCSLENFIKFHKNSLKIKRDIKNLQKFRGKSAVNVIKLLLQNFYLYLIIFK